MVQRTLTFANLATMVLLTIASLVMMGRTQFLMVVLYSMLPIYVVRRKPGLMPRGRYANICIHHSGFDFRALHHGNGAPGLLQPQRLASGHVLCS